MTKEEKQKIIKECHPEIKKAISSLLENRNGLATLLNMVRGGCISVKDIPEISYIWRLTITKDENENQKIINECHPAVKKATSSLLENRNGLATLLNTVRGGCISVKDIPEIPYI